MNKNSVFVSIFVSVLFLLASASLASALAVDCGPDEVCLYSGDARTLRFERTVSGSGAGSGSSVSSFGGDSNVPMPAPAQTVLLVTQTASADAAKYYEALRDADRVWKTLGLPFYSGCAKRLDALIKAAEDTPCGTIYGGVDLVRIAIPIAYGESNCGRPGTNYFMGAVSASTDTATQIRESARLICAGLRGISPYVGCKNNLNCVLNKYTPPCRDNNACDVNAVRIKRYNALGRFMGVT